MSIYIICTLGTTKIIIPKKTPKLINCCNAFYFRSSMAVVKKNAQIHA
jgi:hypothetical protein